MMSSKQSHVRREHGQPLCSDKDRFRSGVLIRALRGLISKVDLSALNCGDPLGIIGGPTDWEAESPQLLVVSVGHGCVTIGR